MAKRPGKQIAEATAEPLTKGGEAAEKIVKGNAEALTASGSASRAAVQELTRAYQELATKNAKNLTAAIQVLAAVKSPAEFLELQQRLIKEGVEAAVRDVGRPGETGLDRRARELAEDTLGPAIRRPRDLASWPK